MAKAYFDSSVLLSILLNEPLSSQASELWHGHDDRVSSVLLEAECVVNLRKYAFRLGNKVPNGWIEVRSSLLSESLNEISVQKVDAEILSIIRRETVLAECRTLDAIHLATLIFIKEHAEENVALVTFDERMRQTATKMKLTVLPANL